MNKNILTIFILLALTSFLIGCSANPTTPSAANTNTPSNSVTASTSGTVIAPASDTIKDITIEAYSFGFKQTGPQINKGDKVRITFTVTDGKHSFILPAYNIEFTPMGPGQTQSATFIANKSGTFEYHCNNPCGPGHADMVGNLVVN